MKLFGATGVTGKAGEFYFAYWIVRNFQWPCRILDIDVGIDAQVEVFEDEISTGSFFAVQIKSTIGFDPKIQIDLADFEYWLQIENNVILASVTFNQNTQEPDIYWKFFSHDELNQIIKHAKSNGYNTKLITFSPNQKLEPESKEAWLSTFYSELDKELIRIAEELINGMEEHFLFQEDCNELEKDLISFNNEIEEINNLFLSYEQLKDAVLYDRRLKIRAKLIVDAINKFEEHEEALLSTFDIAFDWVKIDHTPNEILPRQLSRNITSKVDNWVSMFNEY